MSRHNPLVRRRAVQHFGRRTSINLEDQFWHLFQDIADQQNLDETRLLEQIAPERSQNLASAVRVFVLDHVRNGGSRH